MYVSSVVHSFVLCLAYANLYCLYVFSPLRYSQHKPYNRIAPLSYEDMLSDAVEIGMERLWGTCVVSTQSVKSHKNDSSVCLYAPLLNEGIQFV